MKYIPADKLIAEIKGIIAAVKAKNHPDELGSIEQCLAAAEIEALNLALDCIKELQQEQPKMNFEDFDKEFAKFSNDPDAMDYAFPIDLADYKDFARHFYELGLNARKEVQP